MDLKKKIFNVRGTAQANRSVMLFVLTEGLDVRSGLSRQTSRQGTALSPFEPGVEPGTQAMQNTDQ